ncbi:MAG TPA: acyltransferase [Polyangiales bacterium]
MAVRERLEHLDGLRGVAAFVVVVFHFMSALTPWLVPDQQPRAAPIAYTPLAVLWNGPFAVSVFFVLSGFVVTNATLRKSDVIWIDVVIRYLRLAIPATISTLVAALLLRLFPHAAAALMQITGSRWLAWTFQGTIPSWENAVYSGMVDIFVSGGSYFNNVLWTLRPEFIGSLACYVICLCEGARARLLATAAFALLALLAGRLEYECFVLGIVLREAWVSGRLPSRLPVVALLCGLLIGSQSGDAAEHLGLGWLPAMLAPGNKKGLLYPIAAALVVYGCMRSRSVARVLSSRVGGFLGQVSFPLYLLHVPWIYTVVSAVAARHYQERGLMFALVVASFGFLLGAAKLVDAYLERPFLRFLGRLRDLLRGLRLRLLAASAAD